MSIELKLDKSTWVKTKLGELAEEISVRVENPSKSQYDRFVGLDCFVSGELKIKKWSETSNVNSSAKAFKAGDVLFARRNAYLKRASLVEFDGCCSGDAFVLRENHDKIVPGFLSFIVNSEKLWSYANSNAEGTMSKRVKWRDLANYEFLLPPKEQQAELAELLWAMDTVIEKDLEVLVRLEEYFNSEIDNKIKGENFITNNIEYFLSEKFILGIQDGNHGELHPKSSDYVPDGIPFIMANTLSKGKINFEKSEKLPKSITDKLRIGFAKEKDVLLSHKGTIGNVAFIDNVNGYEYVMLTPQVTYYRVDESKIIPKYLFYYFLSRKFQTVLKSLSAQSTRSYIGIQAQQKLELSLPISIDKQLEIVNELDDLSILKENLESKLQSSKALQKALINQVF